MAFTLIDLAGGAGGGTGDININLDLQSRTVDSSTGTQLIKPTDGYIGLKDVTINPYVLDSSSANIIQNGDYVFTSAEDGLSRVDVHVDVNDVHDEKTVDSSTVLQIVTSDYDGLDKVTVNPYVLDSKTVNSSTNEQVVTSSEDGLSSVTVEPYVLDSKTVDSSTASQTVTSDADGLSSVTINPYVLDSKTVDSSTNAQVVTSDADGLSQVTINPFVLNDLEVDSSTATQEVTGHYGKVTVNPYELDNKTVDPSTNSQTVTSDKDGLSSVTINPYVLDSKTVDSSTVAQTITSDEDGLSSVTINPYVLDSKTVDPSTNSQTVTSDEDGLSSVTINGVTSSIDSNILAGNIKDGVTILGVQGTFEGGTLQTKTVDSSTNSQVIIPDSGNYGIGQITVNPYTLDSSSAVFTENGEYVFTSGQDGLSRVDVSVNIDTQSYYDSGYSAGYSVGEADGITEQKALLDSSTFTQNGTYTRENGWNEVTVDVDTVNNQSKTVDSSTESQIVTFDNGYTGLSQVTINPYTLQAKNHVVEYHQLVNSDIDSSSFTVYPSNGYNGMSSFSAKRTPILSSVTLNPSPDNSVIWDNRDYNYLQGVAYVRIPKVSNVTPENIKNGVTILGVQGTYSGQSINNQNKTVDSSTNSQSITSDAGYTGLGTVTVNPYVLDSSSAVIDQNGEYVFTSAQDGLSRVDVSVNIDTQSYYNSGYSAGETAGIAEGIAEQKALLDSSTFIENGTYTRENGWNSVTVNIDTSTYYNNGYSAGETAGIAEGIAQQKALLDSSTFTQNGTYTRENGWNEITVQTDTVNNQSKTVDSSTNSQIVTYDNGYTGLSQVTVNPYVLDSSTVDPSTNSQTITSSEDGLSSVIVNAVTSSIDANITAGNIKDGVTILGVQGTYTGATINNQNKTVDSSTNQQSVTYDSGYTGLGTVTVNAYDIDSCYTLAASI